MSSTAWAARTSACSRSRRWRSRLRTAAPALPPITLSGTWCRTALCSTSRNTGSTPHRPGTAAPKLPRQTIQPVLNEFEMSQEQQPIRSRRELRKARDEALATNRNAAPPGAGEHVPASKPPVSKGPASNPPASKRPAAADTGQEDTGRVRRVAPGPVDSPPAGSAAERSSQIRARDRAALRTIKELAEKEEQLSGGGPPTRRQLRLMQLKEQAVTSAMPIVPPADGGASTGKSPASASGSSSGTSGTPAPATGPKPAAQPAAGPSPSPSPRP